MILLFDMKRLLLKWYSCYLGQYNFFIDSITSLSKTVCFIAKAFPPPYDKSREHIYNLRVEITTRHYSMTFKVTKKFFNMIRK